MGQVIDFVKYKKNRNSDVYVEIERLQKEIYKCEGRLLHGTTVSVREQAAIQAMELKMQIVELRQRMGITG